MPKVVVSIPELAVTSRGWEREKEIYVLGLSTDLRGADSTRKDAPIAAYNETIANVAPAVQEAAALQWVVAAVSNVFPHVRPDQPVSLSGSGILLYPNLDPMGMLAVHFVVVESDAGKRDVGNILDRLLEDPAVKSLVTALAATVTQPLLAELMNTLIALIPKALKKNRDDILFAHNHSGFDFDDYGIAPGSSVQDFRVGNDRVHCVLRVRKN